MQVRVLSLPLIDKGVLLGEQPAPTQRAEGSTPSALAVLVRNAPVAERSRHHLAKVDRRVRLPPGALLPCDEAGVPACLSNRRDGFDSRTGRLLRAEAERPGDRLIRGARQVRLLPARLDWGMDWSGASRVSCALRGGFDSRFPDSISTPVAQRRRHLSYMEVIIAGSSPAGSTAEWTGPGCQHGLISRPTPVQIRPPQQGLEVLRPHAALVSAEDRVRPPAGPLMGCSSNRKTPPSQGGNRGAIPRRSTRAGGRKAVIRRPWKPETWVRPPLL